LQLERARTIQSNLLVVYLAASFSTFNLMMGKQKDKNNNSNNNDNNNDNFNLDKNDTDKVEGVPL
jgi:hypothetical protein